MTMHSKIMDFSRIHPLARLIHPPPDVLKSTLEHETPHLLSIVGRRALWLDEADVEYTLGDDDAVIFNSMQALAATLGRETSVRFGAISEYARTRGYQLPVNAMKRTVNLLEEYAYAASAIGPSAVVERVGEHDDDPLHGSGSKVYYRFNPNLQIIDRRTPDYLAHIQKNTTP